MTWTVGLHDDFVPEFNDLPELVQDELLVKMGLLERFGPQLGRPHVDTLKGFRHAKMKELRFNAADGVYSPSIPTEPLSSFVAATNPAAAKISFIAR